MVTNEEVTSSEPDEVKITVNPVLSTTSDEGDESRTLGEEITRIIKNPFNVTNSIDSVDMMKDILTDNN